MKEGFGKILCEEELLLRMALNPWFKLPHIKHMQPDKLEDIKLKMVDILKSFVCLDAPSSNDVSTTDNPPKKPRFWRIQETPSSTTNERSEMSLRMEVESWIDPVDELTSFNIHMFPKQNRDAWIKSFIKYNTAIPSSAAVERLFSIGSDILRPKGTV